MISENILNMSKNRLYSYLLTTDNGGAPCVEKNLFSLAICKPKIRRYSTVGDIIVGISGKSMKLDGKNNRIIFIAFVTNILSIKNYAIKYPDRSDSIYSQDLKLRPNPFHTKDNVNTDLNGKNVILSNNFIYFGDKHIAIPDNLYNIIPYRSEQYKPNEKYKISFIDFFEQQIKQYGIGKIGQHNNKRYKKCKKI